jgi:ElaB/YqjD/DUF883 family membrane-anchored ribosome-binding protein
MTSAIVFSRDRAAQLDLLLSSIKENAPSLFQRTAVLFTHSSKSFRSGYQKCMDEHEDVLFVKERAFQEQLRAQVERADKYVAFLCDDDIFYRWMVEPTLPHEVLAAIPEVLCVSLRLGHNTTWCYPHAQKQRLPRFAHRNGMEVFKWTTGDFDFAYPGSLDGNVFRKDQLRYLVSEGPWNSPNDLEEHLNYVCRRTTATPLMACYKQSLLLGNPVNRVQQTHRNRVGEQFPVEPFKLNTQYLDGRRLRVQDLAVGLVKSAHHEVSLAKEET